MAMINEEYKGYTITTDKALMDVRQVHRWLSEWSYWSRNIPFDIVRTAFDNSFCIGIVKGAEQVGFARLITDQATFGYLADVYVTEPHRGKGLSKKMMALLMNIDWVKGLRGIKLATSDAHGLYKQFGFTAIAHPEKLMELSRPDIYQQDTKMITL